MAQNETANPMKSAIPWRIPSGPTISLFIVHNMGEKCSNKGVVTSE
jgi:hypothetical protein